MIRFTLPCCVVIAFILSGNISGDDALLDQIGSQRGIVAVVDLPQGGADEVVELAMSTELVKVGLKK